jgi:hypothetical protein
MKAINPDVSPEVQQRVVPLWRPLFSRTFRLVAKQLIACPASTFHEDESLVSKHYLQNRCVSRMLAAGVSFHSPAQIERYQLGRQFGLYVGGSDSKAPINPRDALGGDLSAWTPNFRLDLNRKHSSAFIESLRTARDEVPERMRPVLDFWRRDGNSFDDVYLAECRAYGPAVMRKAQIVTKQMIDMASGKVPLSKEYFVGSDETGLLLAMRSMAPQGEDAKVVEDKMANFLASDEVTRLPFLHISSLIYAGMARRFAGGKKELSRSFITDVRLISVLSPYCDAVLIDNEMYGLLAERDIAARLGISTKFFSTETLPDLIKYLDGIEASAPPAHLALLDDVYGPYTEPDSIGETLRRYNAEKKMTP